MKRKILCTEFSWESGSESVLKIGLLLPKLWSKVKCIVFWLTVFIYCVSKNGTALACCNFQVHQPNLIIFGRNVAKKVRSQMALYLSTSPN